MSKIFKNNKQAGFFEILIVVIIGLLLMKYFGVTVSNVVAWVKIGIEWFMTFFKDILK